MSPTKLYTKHLFFSFLFLLALSGGLFLSIHFLQNFLINPSQYINTDLPTADIHFDIVLFCLIIIIVLLSFIFYLLLTFHTRFQLQIWNVTKKVALSGEQFKKLYDNAPMPYIMLGKNAEVHDPNKATLRFFGVKMEDIEDKNLFSFILKEAEDEQERFFRYYRTGVPIDKKEVKMVTKSGVVKIVLLSVYKMTNPANPKRDTGLAMIFDITEQKLLDKNKTEFLSLASHQLRTPLATNKWYTEMLASGDLGELNPQQREYIERLNIVNRDMIDLVDVLLNVSRIEMGTLPVDVQVTNVEELAESILTEMSPQIENKKIKIERRYDGYLQNLNTDPKLLRIVLHNLISNAIKYTLPGGQVSIIFDGSNGNKGNKITIADTGIGIPQAEQGRIFSKSFRANNALNLGNVSGTGLGLYLVQSVVESMGGSISFVSEENKGSAFTLTL